MDADDVAWPRRLALQVGSLNEHPQVGIVGGATPRGERLRSNGCNTTTISNEIIGAVATRAALFATIGELEVSKRLIHQACDRARSVQLDAATRGRRHRRRRRALGSS
jgi:hypothetical protein